MNREELAYCAGVFDGEGHISCRITVAKRSRRPALALQITVSQTESFMLERFKRQFGGGVYFRNLAAEGRKEQWRWQSSKRETIQNAVAQMWPWLGPIKRAQAMEALGFWLYWKGVNQLA